MTTFENNGRSFSKNIVNMNLKQSTNLYCIVIWCTYVQRKHILISVPDKTENSFCLKQFTVKGHN